MSESSENSIPADDYWRPNLTYPFNNGINSCWYTGTDEDQISSAPSPDTASPVEEITTERRMKTLAEDMKRNAYRHVPHKERPPLIVARRNARERRRVQAVNTAFMRLRKIVPIVHNRGKRISKVKTLQTAIDYISGLQTLLKQADMYHDLDIISNYRYENENFVHEFDVFEPEF